jgi:hypothetical protein
VGATAKRFKVRAQEGIPEIRVNRLWWLAATCCGTGNADEFFFQYRDGKPVADVHQL